VGLFLYRCHIFTERIVISTTRTAALVETLEIGRPYPVLWVEVIQLWDDPMVLKLWGVTVGEFDCVLPTGCYQMFTLRDICDIQCVRLVSIVYRACVLRRRSR
jgi:hypothetical protein